MLLSGPVGLVSPVAGAPLSAEQVEERTGTISDGKPASEPVMVISKIYRDGAGRMRMDWQIEGDHHETCRVAYVLDPVTGCMYMLLVDAKAGLRSTGPASEEFRVGFPAIGEPLPDRNWREKTEALGNRVIQNVEVEGSRIVRTSEGEPLQMAVEERWRSARLHSTLLAEASGPGWRHTARLEKISHQEPDPSLFVVPDDYNIQE